VVSGIKEISTEVSGIGIKATLVLETQNDRVALKMENIRLGQTVHEKLQSWQTFEVPMSYEALTQEAQALALPITATYVNGKIHEVRPTSEDPMWSVNIKRAILTLLNLHLRPAQKYTHEKPNTYSVLEDGIGGQCSTFYVVEKVPEIDSIKTDNAFHVTKTRDYKNCVHRPRIMTSSYPIMKCSDCESDNVQILNNGDVINYKIMGHPSKYVIKKITSDGYTTFAPYTAKADQLTTMHRIVISLEETEEVMREFAHIDASKLNQYKTWTQEEENQEWNNEWTQEHVKNIRSRRSILGGKFMNQRSSASQSPLFREWKYEKPTEQSYDEQVYGQQPYERNEFFGQEEGRRYYETPLERDETRGNILEQGELLGQGKTHYGKNYFFKNYFGNDYYGKNYYGKNYYGKHHYGGNNNFYGGNFYGQEENYYGKNHYNQFSVRHLNQQGQSSLQYQFPEFYVQKMSEQDLKKPNPLVFHSNAHIQVELNQVLGLFQTLLQSVSVQNHEAFIEAPLQYLTLIKQVRRLDFEQQMRLVETVAQTYGQQQEQETEQPRHLALRLLTDVLAASGTNPSILVLKHMIERDIIPKEIAAQAIQAIPTYVIQPSNELIHVLMELTKTPVVREHKQLFKTLVMTIGEMISMTSSPRIHTTAKFVPRDQPMRSQFVKELISMLESTEERGVEAALIQALGLTAHHEIIPVLAHYVNDKSIPVYLRTKAIYSLHRVAKYNQHQIWSLLRPVFRDTAEQTEVRVAAFDILLAVSDPNSFLERVAAMTWEEPDQELVSYIFSTLKSLAAIKTPCYKDLTQYAKVALDVCKPVEGIQHSKSMMWTTFAEHFGLGSNLHLAYIQGRHSVIPRVIHLRLGNILANHWFQPLEATFHTHGIQHLLNKILGPEAWENKDFESYYNEQYEGQRELNQEEEQMNLKYRHHEPLLLSLYTNFLGNQHRQYNLNKETLKNIVSEYGQYYSGTPYLLRALESGFSMHYIHAMNLFDFTYHVPNPTGLPLILQVEAPTIIKMKSHLKAVLPTGEQKDTQITLDVAPRISTQVVARMGVYAPFFQKFSGAGVKISGQVALPFRGEMEIKNNKIAFGVMPHSIHAPQVVPFVKYEVVPFTVLAHVEQFINSPVVRITPIMKRHQIKTFEHDLSSVAFGAPLVFVGEYEKVNPLQRKGHEYQTQYMYDNNKMHQMGGFLNQLNFWFANPVSSYRNVEIKFRPSAQHERKLQLVFSMDITPSQVSEEFLAHRETEKQGQKTLAGLFQLLSGWTKVPAVCDNENTRHYQMRTEEQDQPRSWRQYLSEWTAHRQSYYGSEEQKINNYRTQAGRNVYDEDYTNSGRMSQTPARLHKFDKASIGSRVTFQLQALARGQTEKTLDWRMTIVKESPLQYTTSFKLLLNQEITHSEPIEVCGNMLLNYPKVPCKIEAIFDPRSYGPVTSKAQITWGKHQCDESKYFKFQMVADKSEQQLKREENPEAWYFRQCQKDHKKGATFSRACQLAIEDLSSLNRLNMQIRHTKLPYQVRHVLNQLDTIIRTEYYPQPLYRPQLHDESEMLEIETEVEEGHPVFNVKVLQPEHQILYQNIRSHFLGAFLLPVPTRTSHLHRTASHLTNGNINPRCYITGNTIKTFEDRTIKAEFTPCKYIISQDCTPSKLFKVLARPVGEYRKKIEIVLYGAKHFIVLPSHVKGQSSVEIIVDGEKKVISIGEVNIVKTQQKTLGMIVYDDSKITFVAPKLGLKVKTDGIHVNVQVSNMLRGRVCGLCGEMIHSKKSQLMGPNKCVHLTHQSFVESYMLPEGGQCQKTQQPEPICLHKEEFGKSRIYNPFQEYMTLGKSGRYYGQHYEQKLFGHWGEHYGQMYYGRRQHNNQYQRQHYGSQQEYYPEGHQQMYGRYYPEGHQQMYGRYNQQHRYGQEPFYGRYETPFNYQGEHFYGNQHQQKPYWYKQQQNEEFDTFSRRHGSYNKNHQKSLFEGEDELMGQGLKKKTLVKEYEIESQTQLCFSLHPVTKCAYGYKPVSEEHREVRFHCLPAHSERAREYASQAETQVLHQMANKQVTMTKNVKIDLACVVAA
jgi:hypothetical protein